MRRNQNSYTYIRCQERSSIEVIVETVPTEEVRWEKLCKKEEGKGGGGEENMRVRKIEWGEE